MKRKVKLQVLPFSILFEKLKFGIYKIDSTAFNKEIKDFSIAKWKQEFKAPNYSSNKNHLLLQKSSIEQKPENKPSPPAATSGNLSEKKEQPDPKFDGLDL